MLQSMISFMLDPTGDAPWEEDQSARNVVHINSEKVLVLMLSFAQNYTLYRFIDDIVDSLNCFLHNKVRVN